jgi:hypothetical protein
MLPRERIWHPPSTLFLVSRSAIRLSLCLLLIITLRLQAQQMGSSPEPVLPVDAVSNSATSDDTEKDPNPTAIAEPAWLITRDSAGNVGQRISVRSDFAIGEQVRLGLMLGQGFVYNMLANSPARTEQIHDAGVIGQWHPNQIIKVDGMVGVSQLGDTVTDGGQSVRQAVIPVTNLQLHIAPSGETVKLDVGFKRFIFDLSPELIAHRTVRNDFLLHPRGTWSCDERGREQWSIQFRIHRGTKARKGVGAVFDLRYSSLRETE